MVGIILYFTSLYTLFCGNGVTLMLFVMGPQLFGVPCSDTIIFSLGLFVSVSLTGFKVLDVLHRIVGVQHLVLELGTGNTPLAAFPNVERPEVWKRKRPCEHWTMEWACKSFDGLMDTGVGTRWETRKICGVARGLPRGNGRE